MADVFRTPDERFEDLPGFGFQPHYAEVDGLRLHYVDEGAGDPVICFHGEPTWSYLDPEDDPGRSPTGGSRVVCPDYPGFGRSDKPTARDWYTYDRHVEHMTPPARISSTSGRRPSWCRIGAARSGCGGRSRPGDRVQRLVIMNTGLFAGKVNEAFMGVAQLCGAQSRPAGRVRDPGSHEDRRAPKRS